MTNLTKAQKETKILEDIIYDYIHNTEEVTVLEIVGLLESIKHDLLQNTNDMLEDEEPDTKS